MGYRNSLDKPFDDEADPSLGFSEAPIHKDKAPEPDDPKVTETKPKDDTYSIILETGFGD